MSNDKTLHAYKSATRHNSEPQIDSLETLQRRAHHRMTSLPQEVLSDETTGIFSRLKTEFIKRVSRVMSEEDIVEPDMSPDYDPNLKPMNFHSLTLKALESHKINHPLDQAGSSERVWKRSPATRRRTESDRPALTQSEHNEHKDSEVYNVLKDLKENGECSRKSIVKKVVELTRGEKYTLNTQGTQFGLRIVGGKKTAGGMLCAFIASIAPGGPAEKSGQLLEGELVLKWNDIMLIGMTYEQCQQTLHADESVTIVTSTFLRGSYRRYRPRSNKTTTGSVESILRGTTHKWITIARRNAQNKEILKALTLSSADVSKELDTSPSFRLELQLMYVAMDSRLSVHLIQAANVPIESDQDGIDLFCKLQLHPETSIYDTKRRSKTSQRTYSPYWNQHFEFQPIEEELLSKMKLDITLWSHHWLHKDQLVGQLELDLHQKKVLTGQAVWYKLKVPENIIESSSVVSEERPKSLPDMIKDKVVLQHRMTFSSFDQKKETTEVRRSASDSSKPQKGSADEDSDNVFTSQSLQQQLTNIKESDPEQKPPIQVRGSPRRTPRVIRIKQVESEEDRQKCMRTCRSNSEDYTTKARILPKIPHKSRKEACQTLPKRMISPVLQAERYYCKHPQVVLTAPSSEDCSTDSLSSLRPNQSQSTLRPNPEGRIQVTRSSDSELLGPGQISVPGVIDCSTTGSVLLTLCIEENMLTIEVVKAKDLPYRTSGLPPDTYIKTYILLEQHKSHKEKTSIVKQSTEPRFNETITYIVNPIDKVLQVMVWDELGTLRRNTLLGEALIDLNYVSSHASYQGWFKLQRHYSSQPLLT